MLVNSVWIAAGAFLGAVSRFGVGIWLGSRSSSGFPFGTLAVNLSGSFLLGLAIGLTPGASFLLFFGTGFLGAFTTFSTLKLELVRMIGRKEGRLFWLYMCATYTAGLLLAWLGYEAA